MDDFMEFLRLETDLFRRRLRGMAMIARGIVPNLVISQRVVDKIVNIAHQFIADETGESMVGLIVAGEGIEQMPTIYVMDTISPDEAETLRRTHTFQQGDDLQDEIIWWLQENWRLSREVGRDALQKPLQGQWNVPLRYLGDWHKQPGFMIQPSGGDLMTALSWLDDDENNNEYLLVPIVTLGHEDVTSDQGGSVNYFSVSMGDETALRVDWWFIHRDVRIFQPICPIIKPAAEMPALVQYPWHLVYPDRAEDEVGVLQDEGLFVELLVWQADDSIPMELCLFVARPGASKVLLIITEHDYPKEAPRARVAPFMRFNAEDEFYEIFQMFWENSEPLDNPPDWKWTAEKRLIDYVFALEKHLGIQGGGQPRARPQVQPTAQTHVQQNKAVSIPVEVDGKKPAKSHAKGSPKPVPRREAAPQEDED